MSELLDRVRPYTMVSEPALRDLAGRVHGVIDSGVPGAFVECGVWRGGSSFLMAELAKRRGETGRTTWMFDSFEGLPPPQDIDGPGAKAYAEDVENPLYYDNCRAELDEVRAAARELGLEAQTEIVPGWFDQTLGEARERIGPIALLRIDCDWYDPVLFCLETLYDQVSPGGVLIVDDYYQWDGCTIATHEFLARRELPLRVTEAAQMAVLWKPT
jgi:O-methyltransferase